MKKYDKIKDRLYSNQLMIDNMDCGHANCINTSLSCSTWNDSIGLLLEQHRPKNWWVDRLNGFTPCFVCDCYNKTKHPQNPLGE